MIFQKLGQNLIVTVVTKNEIHVNEREPSSVKARVCV